MRTQLWVLIYFNTNQLEQILLHLSTKLTKDIAKPTAHWGKADGLGQPERIDRES